MDKIHEYSSYFDNNKCLFGSYPKQENVRQLEDIGVRYFINLTNEDLYNYLVSKSSVKIKYIITDRYIPTNIYTYCKFIHRISNIINNLEDNEKIYIHCKGGHGRAGIVVACLLCYHYKYTSTQSLKLTTTYHNQRTVMREKWRNIGSPQTPLQKNFVIRLFKPIYLTNIDNINTYYQLSVYNNINNIENYLNNRYDNNENIRQLLNKTLIKPIIFIYYDINIGLIWENIRKKKILETETETETETKTET